MMWKHWVVFFVLLILALLTRFWGLGDFDVSPDEYHFIGDAFRLFNNDPFMNARHHPFSHGVPFIGHPFLAQDLMVLFFRLFGPSVWAGRAVMAFANILTIMGVYLLGRWWISKKAGLLAMFLIIILPLDVRYARDAHLDSLLAANLTWATIALDRLLSTKRIFWAVIFGFFSALTIATKINGPILFLYDGAIFLLLFLFKKGMDLRAHIHHVLFASFIFALVAFLLVDPSAYLDGLLHPSDPVASTAIPWFFQGGWYHFVWLHLIPHFYTIVFLLLVFVGVVVAVRLRTQGSLLLLAWLGVWSHIFLTHNGHSGPYGYMPLNPVFVLLATLAFIRLPKIPQRVVLFALVMLFLPLTLGNGLRLSLGPIEPTSKFFDSNFLSGQRPYRDAAQFLNRDTRQRLTVLWIKQGDRPFPHMDLRDGINVTPFTSMEEAMYGLTADEDWKRTFEQNGFELARTFAFRDDVLYLFRKTT